MKTQAKDVVVTSAVDVIIVKGVEFKGVKGKQISVPRESLKTLKAHKFIIETPVPLNEVDHE